MTEEERQRLERTRRTIRLVADAATHVSTAFLQTELAQEAVHKAGDSRDNLLKLQETVMKVLNLPTAGELGQMNARMRSVSQRLEDLEDNLVNVGDQLEGLAKVPHLLETIVEQTARSDSAGPRPEQPRG
ncbi:hypothetical protein HLB23_23310 [Nocardia uniformis]|uniref:Uncharacterized protein n=1 Tax=Nocardia uniformis TaxID=53432 RepID=A0A849C522_9NOCA|nr:hypothetical protein [Nocardia uniformis]NNH72756.1 hypothetical protein [Nocardia uniformis]